MRFESGSSWQGITSGAVDNGAYSGTVSEASSIPGGFGVSDVVDGVPSAASSSNFSMPAAPVITITILAPNGGENLTAGSQYTIKWTSSIRFDSINIKYYDGTAWKVIINGTVDDGAYTWTIPDVTTSNAKLWIEGFSSSGNATDFSNNTFTLTGSGGGLNVITITSPNGGEILTGGSVHNITWKSSVHFSKIDIEYNDGSNWIVIVNGTADDGSYAWSVPNISTEAAKIWIKGYDNKSNPTDYSDSTFTISPSGSITITSPNGGEVWAGGSTKEITWTSGGEVGNVKISYSLDNGSGWTTIVSSTANDGIYSWLVPNTLSDYCLVKINDVTHPAIADVSNNVFIIGGSPEIVLNKDRLNFGYVRNGASPCTQTLFIYNGGGGDLNWTAAASASWINLDKVSGNSGESVTISINPSGLGVGTHMGTVSVSAAAAENSPQTADIYLTVKNSSQDQLPFGEFATPLDGTANVSGSIAVTGWVLDDICVDSVKLYRQEGGGLSFIGDAVFVEGARPDVEAAYPDYPYSSRAGWGYMLLTNFLPDGVLVLKAIARDTTGHQTVLGTKTINLDNAHAVKPFGAIDSPTQGGEASAANFRNNGWALTPSPNKIPENGSTIKVFIDGSLVGNATYNLYRADIAGLFPGYANSNGAWGYLDFDTTAYSNGVHTIAWSVTDDANNNDGIGSRYFSIMNSGNASRSSAKGHSPDRNALPLPGEPISNPGILSLIPLDDSLDRPICLKRGYSENTPFQELYPQADGVKTIEIKELERIAVRLPGYSIGYMLVKDQPRFLPVGSGMDPVTGVFSWQVGPGFLGIYDFVFIGRRENGEVVKTFLRVAISPGFENPGK